MFVYVLFLIYGFLIGGAFASFAGVVAERIPAGESISGRSKCICGHQLRVFENIPVFGWVRVWGVAPCCGSKIPARYVISELAASLLCAGVFVFIGHLFIINQISAAVGVGLAILTLAIICTGCVVILRKLPPVKRVKN